MLILALHLVPIVDAHDRESHQNVTDNFSQVDVYINRECKIVGRMLLCEGE